MATIILPGLAPAPPVLPGAGLGTLAEAERETASRLGPFFVFTATGGSADAVTVSALRSTAPVGGYEGLYLLRREATQADDRVRTVDRFDGPAGNLVVDFPYTGHPAAGEVVELHHLHPDLQLLTDVHAALRRCYLLDVLAVAPPPDGRAAAASATEATAYAVVGRATVREVATGDTDGWLLYPPNGNGAGASTADENGRRLRAEWGALASGAGLTERSQRAGRTGDGATAVVDLTAQAPWLTASRQVLAVAVDGVALPPCGRYGGASGAGWACYTTRGRVYLSIPGGVPLDGLAVRAYRDAFGLVNGVDSATGPLADDDVLAVPLDYVCALAHIEAWRRHRDRLEASAAEGRFATQVEAATEATRVASLYADFLFRPQTERPDRPGSPWGGAPAASPSGLGGTGALAGAVVNQNNPWD